MRAPEEFYSDVPAKGSFDAAYAAAAEAEAARYANEDVSGFSFDLPKASDRIPRCITYATAIKSGMPPRISLAYYNYIENLRVRNVLALGTDKAHKRMPSIPQGSPFSVVFLFMVAAPWAHQIKRMGGSPRIMVDDLSIRISGPHFHKEAFLQLLARTWIYIHVGLRGKLSLDKCNAVPFAHQGRFALERLTWHQINWHASHRQHLSGYINPTIPPPHKGQSHLRSVVRN